MSNENPVPVDGLETPESRESAEKAETVKKSGVSLSRLLLPVLFGAMWGVLMSRVMPRLWFMWVIMGALVGLSLDLAFEGGAEKE